MNRGVISIALSTLLTGGIFATDNIDIIKGWNQIYLYSLGDISTKDLEDKMQNNLELIWMYEPYNRKDTWLCYSPNKSSVCLNNEIAIDKRKSIWIKSKENLTLLAKDDFGYPAKSFGVHNGWNLIFTGKSEKNIDSRVYINDLKDYLELQNLNESNKSISVELTSYIDGEFLYIDNGIYFSKSKLKELNPSDGIWVYIENLSRDTKPKELRNFENYKSKLRDIKYYNSQKIIDEIKKLEPELDSKAVMQYNLGYPNFPNLLKYEIVSIESNFDILENILSYESKRDLTDLKREIAKLMVSQYKESLNRKNRRSFSLFTKDSISKLADNLSTSVKDSTLELILKKTQNLEKRHLHKSSHIKTFKEILTHSYKSLDSELSEKVISIVDANDFIEEIESSKKDAQEIVKISLQMKILKPY